MMPRATGAGTTHHIVLEVVLITDWMRQRNQHKPFLLYLSRQSSPDIDRAVPGCPIIQPSHGILLDEIQHQVARYPNTLLSPRHPPAGENGIVNSSAETEPSQGLLERANCHVVHQSK